MNIKVQCSGLVLLALFAVINRRQKKLNLISSKVFQGCFYASFLCVVVDILSIFGIVYRTQLPAFLPEFVCKAYLVTLILVGLMSVIYIAAGVSFHFPNYRNNILAFIVFAVLMSVLIYALPIDMYEDVEAGRAWTDGPSTYMTYFGVLVFLLINLIQIFWYKQYIYERQRRTVVLWMFMWIGAACIQGLLHNHILIVGFAVALGIAAVFIQFENSELNLDRDTGLFNYLAFTRYGEQLYSGNDRFYVIAVMFENLAWQAEQDSNGRARSHRIFDSFMEISEANAFRIMENEVLLFFSSEESARSSWKDFMIKAKKERVQMDQGQISCYYVEDPRCVSSHRELLELLQYASFKRKDSRSGGFYTVESHVVAQMLSERRMTQLISEALKEDRLLVYYQPIYSVAKKCFTSAEALVRIIDAEGNLIPPGDFIPIAESNGMIIEIGRRVFEKVCYFYQKYRLEQYGIQYIDVNLSIVQCADDRLADNYMEIMKNAKIDPHRLNLEITESASLRAKQVLISNMEKMIDYGMHFSLDDFGTGKSNLDYFVDMPVRVVKFDKEMIQSYFVSDKAKYVMDAAMSMIHGMGLEIVAEGIETKEQYEKMEEIKINYIQGYYFSRPLPEQEFLNFLLRVSNV